MYIPKSFEQNDTDSLIHAIETIKFGVLVIYADNQFYSCHIPFIIKKNKEHIQLEGHVAIKNEIWKMANRTNKAIVIFQGVNAYIHPGWYPSKDKNGKVVPTWNYQAIHCHGFAENELSETWLLNHVTELTKQNENHREIPWEVSDAPCEFINKLIKGIVGIKIDVLQIEGALKMSQHHTKENILGAIQGLSDSNNPHDMEVSKIMRNLQEN